MKNIHSLQLLSIIETNASIARENYLEKKISREILRGEFAFRINFEKKKVTIQIQV